MITESQNIALKTVGEAAMQVPEWTDYANYCLDREKGLRKEAFAHLGNFLKQAENWTIAKKIAFAQFLLPFFEKIEDADYGPFPQPLNAKLIKPTLEQWCETEENNSNPFRWYGKYYRSEAHLLKAIAICPTDDLARQVLINWWTEEIYHSTHHLPDYYIGDPYDDIKTSIKVKEQVDQLSNDHLKTYWTNDLDTSLVLVKNYIDWQVSGHPDFEKWGLENNRETSYGLSRVYYYEG